MLRFDDCPHYRSTDFRTACRTISRRAMPAKCAIYSALIKVMNDAFTDD
jgi:hypothetical protein